MSTQTIPAVRSAYAYLTIALFINSVMAYGLYNWFANGPSVMMGVLYIAVPFVALLDGWLRHMAINNVMWSSNFHKIYLGICLVSHVLFGILLMFTTGTLLLFFSFLALVVVFSFGTFYVMDEMGILP